MRALICDLRTGRFYAADGRWTSKRDEAREFGNALLAMVFAEENRLGEVDVVVTSGPPGNDVRGGLRRKGRQN
jgi:hypothetical protein